MRESPLKRLDPGRYGNLVRLAAGAELPLALCDDAGVSVWTSDGCARTGIGGLLEERAADAFAAESAPAAVLELEAGGALVTTPVEVPDAGRLGWLAGLVPEAAGLERCREALVEAARRLGEDATSLLEVVTLADELADRHEELNLVYSFARHLRADAASEGIRLVLRDFADSMFVEMAVLQMADGRSIVHRQPDVAIENLDLVLTQLRSNLARFVSTRKGSVILNNDERDRALRSHLFCDMPFRVLAQPMVHEKTVEGVLMLLRRPSRQPFSVSDRNLAAAIVSQAGLVLRHHAMVERLQRFGEQLAGAMIAAVEAKDPYTRGHSERVQQLSVRLGQCLELSGAEVEDISWGALLHDVGKIGVPDAILTKPLRLTEDEYVFIKEHPERSYEIIRHIEYLRPGALHGARYHQEKFDGTGYPHGLAGEHIPYLARVIAVADTYDAITSSRAYRPARDHEEALTRIRDASGSQLDPDVVEAFDRLCAAERDWLEQLARPAGF